LDQYNPEVFTKIIKAGKRTYFFDVRTTKNNGEYYITITEKKRNEDTLEKYKLFLYKEDFEKFLEALKESIEFAKKNNSKQSQSGE
jgi:tRNA/tmRNA/rRNA uracil-C5-methylase (TrmA/RlmC/RlmD family)